MQVTASRSFNPATVKRGQADFGTACASCHGANARGGVPGQTAGDLLRSPIVLDDVGGKRIGEYLDHGHPVTGVPKFSLSEAQVTDIADFLHYNIGVVSERNAYHYKDILVGDPQAGKAYFDGAGGCTKCHSVTGDLKGIASKDTPPEIQYRIIAGEGAANFFGPAAGSAATEKTATITLPSGKTVTGPLTFINDFVITIRSPSGAPESFFRNGDQPKVVIKNPLAAHVRIGRTLSDKNMHDLTAYLETLK